jgi:hypothetical protein
VDEKQRKRRQCDFEDACASVEVMRQWQIQHEKVHERQDADSKSNKIYLQDGVNRVEMKLSATHIALTEELTSVKERLNTVVVIGGQVVNTLKSLVYLFAASIIAVLFKKFFP